jgi:hypothetical protein
MTTTGPQGPGRAWGRPLFRCGALRAFISGITVRPDEARLDLMVNPIPVLSANSSVGLVAGARYEPLQMEMKPVERFLAGFRRAA